MEIVAQGDCHTQNGAEPCTHRVGERVAWLKWNAAPGTRDWAGGLVTLLESPRFVSGMPVVMRLPDNLPAFSFHDLRAISNDLWLLAEAIGRVAVVAKENPSLRAMHTLSALVANRGIELRSFRNAALALEWAMEEPPIRQFMKWFSRVRWQGDSPDWTCGHCEGTCVSTVWEMFLAQNGSAGIPAALYVQVQRQIRQFACHPSSFDSDPHYLLVDRRRLMCGSHSVAGIQQDGCRLSEIPPVFRP